MNNSSESSNDSETEIMDMESLSDRAYDRAGVSDPVTIPCGICGRATRHKGTKRCDRCWELESRVKADPELTVGILRKLGYTVSVAKLRKAKEERPAGWSEGAWQHYLAACRSKTSEPEKIAAAAMAACDRVEGPPGNVPSFRYHFRYGAEELANKMAAFAKLGVSEGLTVETKEEYERAKWERELRGEIADIRLKLADLRDSPIYASAQYGYSDRFITTLDSARRLIRAGRAARYPETRQLVKLTRSYRNKILERYGSLQKNRIPISPALPTAEEQEKL